MWITYEENGSYIYIVMEYCDGGDLSSFIHSRQKLNEKVCRLFLQQLASALQYLRQNNVSHMDLKPKNLLLSSKTKPKLKLADFGLAQSLGNGEIETSLKGSPLYMAPEILLNKGYDASVDLWSVGVILYESLFGKAPYSSQNMADLIEKIKTDSAIKIPTNVKLSAEVEDLLKRLLERKPEQRITFDEFFNHPFITVVPAEVAADKDRQITSLIQRAKDYESTKRTNEAFDIYCDVLKLLIPIVQSETDLSRKVWFQERADFCFKRAEKLKALQSSSKDMKQTPLPTNSTVAPFDELRALVSTTPSLKSALDIGVVAVQYDAEGQYSNALERYEAALKQIIQFLSKEPRGKRKELLHHQASIWMSRAEKIKSQLVSCPEAQYEDMKQCSIQ